MQTYLNLSVRSEDMYQRKNLANLLTLGPAQIPLNHKDIDHFILFGQSVARWAQHPATKSSKRELLITYMYAGLKTTEPLPLLLDYQFMEY